MDALWWVVGGGVNDLVGWLVAVAAAVGLGVLLVWVGWRVAGHAATGPVLGVVLVASGAAILASWRAAEAASGWDGLGFALLGIGIAVCVSLPTVLVGVGTLAARLHARRAAR